MAESVSTHPSFGATLAGFGISTALEFPLFKAVVNAQTGVKPVGSTAIERFLKSFGPPYKGVPASVANAAVCRSTIFYGSSYLKAYLAEKEVDPLVAKVASPLVAAPVTFMGHPLYRATVLLQNPSSHYTGTWACLRGIVKVEGVAGLFSGAGLNVLRSFPKYFAAFGVKETLAEHRPACGSQNELMAYKALESVAASVSAPLVGNPFDVVVATKMRPENAKKHYSQVLGELWRECGPRFAVRGLGKSLISSGTPMALGLLLSDLFSKKTDHK